MGAAGSVVSEEDLIGTESLTLTDCVSKKNAESYSPPEWLSNMRRTSERNRTPSEAFLIIDNPNRKYVNCWNCFELVHKDSVVCSTNISTGEGVRRFFCSKSCQIKSSPEEAIAMVIDNESIPNRLLRDQNSEIDSKSSSHESDEEYSYNWDEDNLSTVSFEEDELRCPPGLSRKSGTEEGMRGRGDARAQCRLSSGLSPRAEKSQSK